MPYKVLFLYTKSGNVPFSSRQTCSTILLLCSLLHPVKSASLKGRSILCSHKVENRRKQIKDKCKVHIVFGSKSFKRFRLLYLVLSWAVILHPLYFGRITGTFIDRQCLQCDSDLAKHLDRQKSSYSLRKGARPWFIYFCLPEKCVPNIGVAFLGYKFRSWCLWGIILCVFFLYPQITEDHSVHKVQ